MRITDNLKKDIHGAPEWFLEAINVEPKEKYIENPKGNIAYSKWSNKRDAEDLLIFIHGTGAHKRWWDPIAPQFIDFADIIAVDLPGMGNSEFRETYSIKDFGEGIISIIEKEKSNKKNKEY